MLVTLVPPPLDNLPWVRLVFLHTSIMHHTHIVVYVEMEQGPRLASCLAQDEVVEGVVLRAGGKGVSHTGTSSSQANTKPTCVQTNDNNCAPVG